MFVIVKWLKQKIFFLCIELALNVQLQYRMYNKNKITKKKYKIKLF